MVKTQEKGFTYKNQNCAHKIFTRKFLIDKLKELDLREIRYAGLPALSPVMEDYLMSNYQDLKMFLAERDLITYRKQKKLFKGVTGVYQDITHHQGNLLRARTNFPLNFIWFDLCGMLTKDTIDDIYSFFQVNSILPKGLFAITWTASREHGNQVDLYSQLQKRYQNTKLKELKDFKRNQIPEILVKMLSECSGRTFKSELCYPYKASTLQYMQFNALTWS